MMPATTKPSYYYLLLVSCLLFPILTESFICTVESEPALACLHNALGSDAVEACAECAGSSPVRAGNRTTTPCEEWNTNFCTNLKSCYDVCGAGDDGPCKEEFDAFYACAPTEVTPDSACPITSCDEAFKTTMTPQDDEDIDNIPLEQLGQGEEEDDVSDATSTSGTDKAMTAEAYHSLVAIMIILAWKTKALFA